MSADLPQLRILRYAPPLTMLSYPIPLSSLSISLQRHLPSDPPSFLSLSLFLSLPPIGPCFAFIYPPRVPSFPFSLLKPLPSTPHPFLSPPLPSSIQWLDSLREFEKTSGKTRFPARWRGYFKQLLSAFLPIYRDSPNVVYQRGRNRGSVRSSPCLSFIARFATSIHPSPCAASRPINQQAQLDRVARLKSPLPLPFLPRNRLLR